VRLSITVNGAPRVLDANPAARLLDVLREDLGITSAKEGCGEGECGACSVQLDGVLVVSCLVPIGQCDGAAVTTVEGLATAEADRLGPVQRALLDAGGTQCGICTPGIVMTAHALLAANASPSLDEIREALAGNLCRCTGYTAIYDAVRRAAGAR